MVVSGAVGIKPKLRKKGRDGKINEICYRNKTERFQQ